MMTSPNSSEKMTRGSYVSPAMYLHYTTLVMMAVYLLADMMSGFTLITFGLDLKISLIYKIPLFLFLALLIARYNFRWFLGILGILGILLIGPTTKFFQYVDLSIYFSDFGYAVKLLMPITVFAYFAQLYRIAPDFALCWTKRILWSAFIILSFNFILGALGFGRGTYQLEGDDTAGTTGFIYAGNELGPAFLVVFGFVLHQLWNHSKKRWYFLCALFTVAAGLLVATKTAMLAAFLLVSFIPIVNERHNFLKLTWLKIKILAPFFLAIIVIIVAISELLEAIGLYDRMVFFYQKRGIIGILWSGRDIFIDNMFDVYIHQSNIFYQFFGHGTSIGKLHPLGLSGTEVDLMDSLTWFGFFGATICIVFYVSLFYKSVQLTLRRDAVYAPCLFIVNTLLLLLSQLSGHIWMSGTLGILFGVINSLLFFELQQLDKSSCSTVGKDL